MVVVAVGVTANVRKDSSNCSCGSGSSTARYENTEFTRKNRKSNRGSSGRIRNSSTGYTSSSMISITSSGRTRNTEKVMVLVVVVVIVVVAVPVVVAAVAVAITVGGDWIVL
eukprot:7550471-Pyramimonas_sp.AAC.1